MNRSADPARIPSLDGFRAISIGLVMLYHLAFMAGTPVPLRRFAELLHTGALGVRIFFVISGFLITTLLLAERERHGQISLRRFYFRRTLRILPPFYAFLFAMLLATAVGLVPLPLRDWWHAVSFTTNWHPGGQAWTLIHTWSLSIEEQFYLLWPGLVVAAGVAGARRALWLVVGLAAVWRLALYGGVQTAGPMEEYSFHSVADWLAAGALLAILRPTLLASSRYVRALAHPLTPVILLVMIIGCWTGLGYWRRALLLMPGAVFGVALLLDWAMTHPGHLLARPLNWAPIAWVGRLSYSLYLWQQPFLNETGRAWWNNNPWAVPLAFAGAMASYYLVERPALDWRARIEPTLAWLRPPRARS